MGRSAVFSGLLHAAVILLTVLGLPWLYSDQEVLQATSVTTITDAQLAELQSKSPPAQKRQDQPKDETIPPAPDAPPVPEPEVEPEPEPEPEPEAEAEPPPEPAPPEPEPAPPAPVAVVPEPQPAPPAPEPAPPEPEPQPQAEIAPAPQEPVIAEPEPEPQPEEPVVPPEQQLAEAQPKPVPPKKPKEPKKKEDQKKEEPKETPKKDKPEKRTIEQIAEDLKKGQKPNNDRKRKPSKNQDQSQEPASVDPSVAIRLSSGEQDEIVRYIRDKCWSVVNQGAPGFDEFSIEVLVQVNPDGSVNSRGPSRSADRSRMQSDRGYRSFAEDTLRAFDKCRRIPIPESLRSREPYERWKDFRIVFWGADYY